MDDGVVTVSFCYDGAVDTLQRVEAILLGVFEDERPLKGTTGFADWRLHGLLSRLILKTQLTGNLLESCLVPSSGRLPMEKVFLMGLGSLRELDADIFRRVAGEVIATMNKARVKHFAVSIWDLTRGKVAPEEAASIVFRKLLEDCQARRGGMSIRRVTFVESGVWGHALRDGFRDLGKQYSDLPIRLLVS